MVYVCKPSKVRIYINAAKKTAEQIKAETGCDAIINGGLYDMSTFKPVRGLIVDGKHQSYNIGKRYGLAWDENIVRCSQNDTHYRNFIACVCLVRDGKAIDQLDYDPGMGGARQRTAMGVFPDGRIWLYATHSGTTPEQLRQIALDAGVQHAIMLDGGGSTQCIFPDGTLTSARKVHNFICVWAEEEEKPKIKEDKTMAKYKVCVDAGHGGNDTSNGSPDGLFKEYKFTLDVALRIKNYLEKAGIDVILTRDENESVSLATRAAIANAADADLFISVHSNAAGNDGWYSAEGLCVYTSGAGATLAKNILANKIISNMREAGVKVFSKGLYHAGFTVLAQTKMPAVLVEYGFHTDKEETELLKSNDYREKLAYNTAKSICEYLGVAAPAEMNGAEVEKEPAKDNTPAAWEKEAVEWAIANGIIAGDESGDYALHSTVTKAQVACMIYRAIKK